MKTTCARWTLSTPSKLKALSKSWERWMRAALGTPTGISSSNLFSIRPKHLKFRSEWQERAPRARQWMLSTCCATTTTCRSLRSRDCPPSTRGPPPRSCIMFLRPRLPPVAFSRTIGVSRRRTARPLGTKMSPHQGMLNRRSRSPTTAQTERGRAVPQARPAPCRRVPERACLPRVASLRGFRPARRATAHGQRSALGPRRCARAGRGGGRPRSRGRARGAPGLAGFRSWPPRRRPSSAPAPLAPRPPTAGSEPRPPPPRARGAAAHRTRAAPQAAKGAGVSAAGPLPPCGASGHLDARRGAPWEAGARRGRAARRGARGPGGARGTLPARRAPLARVSRRGVAAGAPRRARGPRRRAPRRGGLGGRRRRVLRLPGSSRRPPGFARPAQRGDALEVADATSRRAGGCGHSV